MKIYSVLLCIVVSIAAISATDYCSKKICGSEKHIACGHNGEFDASCPTDAEMVPINDSLKKILVDTHNDKRNFIAGGGDAKHSPACRMATMEWDDELAATAALNVMQCEINHDSCHNTDAFQYSGQNLAWIGFNGEVDHAEKLKSAVEMWYSEVKNSDQSIIDSYPDNYSGPGIGHFTVMMADRNIRLGCAASTYSLKGKSHKAYLIACNYATSNMIGGMLYDKCNKAASKCTAGTNAQYPNLCSASEQYDVNNW